MELSHKTSAPPRMLRFAQDDFDYPGHLEHIKDAPNPHAYEYTGDCEFFLKNPKEGGDDSEYFGACMNVRRRHPW